MPPTTFYGNQKQPLIYLPTWMVDVYGKLVGKYTVRPMDASWVLIPISGEISFDTPAKI